MEAINAVRLTPLSVLSDRRNGPKKIPPHPISFPFKNLCSVENLSRNVQGGLLWETVTIFASENPLIIAGGFAALALPIVLFHVPGKPPPALLDIRAPAELREVGSPDIRDLKKKPVTVVYKGEDKPGFLKKLSLKFKEPEKTTLFILDKFDGNSELVAELVTENGFKAAYAIKDGAEGPRDGWLFSQI
ncbi:hypothetical protein HAX54_010390 [Datura stramonium]|uniref:Rhodanese domain-containing protein n=1 Tax=Datura stramonium TaxID=4076 RepID=A0ABS8TG49_DATST|nr:hypothetical protein [Datura stramonium]